MERPPQDPGRKSRPHLPSLVFPNQSIIQMVTVCVKDRRPLLAQADVHEVLIMAWQSTPGWRVGRYAIMPDHLHLFCAPTTIPPLALKPWVFEWRAAATRAWPRPAEKPVWQKDFDDRQLRSGQSFHQKWLYLWENPLKAGLVRRVEDWPYQGELNVLAWHEPSGR